LGAKFRRLSDGSVLMMGGYDVKFLSGVELEGNGVEPDVVVSESIPDYGRGRDPILERGVEVLLEKCRSSDRRWASTSRDLFRFWGNPERKQPNPLPLLSAWGPPATR
jgi:C-terminal processing protease CtpA/Prc